MTKAVFETAAIADAIKKAARVAPSRGAAFDKAAGIVLDIYPEPLPTIVKATNLEIFSMEWITPLSVEGDHVVWRIGAPMLAAIMATLPIGTGREVVLEEITQGFSSQVHLSSGRTKARFNLMDSKHYPNWSAFEPDNLFKINDLGGKLALVDWAAAKTEVPLNGVYLDGEIAVATDKYRLACVDFKIGELDEPIVVPAGILSSVLRQTGEVSIGVDGHALLIMPDEHTQIRSVVYAEKYPGIARIMRREYPDHVTVRKTELLDILNRANAFAGGDRMPSLKMFIGKQEIAVMMNNEEVGLLGDVVEVPGQCDHDRMEILFTPKNIIDPLNNAPNESVDIYYDRASATSLVYVDGGSGFECWIMPRTPTRPSEARS